ncbi:MAG: hypothetical protein AAFX40_10685 [Cyanobacteria bacterium J06639_1]
MAILDSLFGIIRPIETCRGFEVVKPVLKRFERSQLAPIKRSVVRPKHWLTMLQEIASLHTSSQQVSVANHFGDIPIVSIKAAAFFRASVWTLGMTLKPADRLRDRMHVQLGQLSSRCQTIPADKSGHFVWVDRPDVMMKALDRVLEQVGMD